MSEDYDNDEGWVERPTVPMLRRLQLKNFRSVVAEDIEWANPTFLVGRNGSGKSNIVDAFAFLADAVSGSLQAALERRGGIAAVLHRSCAKGRPSSIGLGVELADLNEEVKEARYALEIEALEDDGFQVMREQCVVGGNGRRHWFDRGPGGEFKSSEADLKPAVAPEALVLPRASEDSRFQPVHRFLSAMRTYCINPNTLRGMQDQTDGDFLRRDGSNTASVLRELKERYEGSWENFSLLGYIAPRKTCVRPIQHGDKLALEFTQDFGEAEPVVFKACDMSEGTLRAVGLMAAAYQKPVPSVLLVEEPETTIYQDGPGAIFDMLDSAKYDTHLIVATHSPDILEDKWIEDRHLRIVHWDNGQTRVFLLSEPARRELQEGLTNAGELLKSGALKAEAEGKPLVQKTDPPRLFQNDLG